MAGITNKELREMVTNLNGKGVPVALHHPSLGIWEIHCNGERVSQRGERPAQLAEFMANFGLGYLKGAAARAEEQNEH